MIFGYCLLKTQQTHVEDKEDGWQEYFQLQ